MKSLQVCLLGFMVLQVAKGTIMTDPKCQKVPRSTIHGGKEFFSVSFIQCAAFCQLQQLYAFSFDDSRCVVARRYEIAPVQVALRLVNYPRYVISFLNKSEVWAQNEATNTLLNMLFEITSGMMGNLPDSVSLRSIDDPSLFLYQEGLLTYMRSTGIPASGSWFIRPGNADPLKPSWISLESVNLPGYYIRHSGFRLCLAPVADTDLWRADSTFNVTVQDI